MINGDINGNISDEILSLGFTFTDSIRLLDFTLQNFKDINASYYELAIAKLENIMITMFWEKFQLGLNGRLAIYKSLLLPQINYIASIMTLSQDNLQRMEQIMEIQYLYREA
jgi:hypothetical protein